MSSSESIGDGRDRRLNVHAEQSLAATLCQGHLSISELISRATTPLACVGSRSFAFLPVLQCLSSTPVLQWQRVCCVPGNLCALPLLASRSASTISNQWNLVLVPAPCPVLFGNLVAFNSNSCFSVKHIAYIHFQPSKMLYLVTLADSSDSSCDRLDRLFKESMQCKVTIQDTGHRQSDNTILRINRQY